MNLLIDQGNTICKIAVCSDSRLLNVWSVSVPTPEIVSEILALYPNIENTIYSSVGSEDERSLDLLSRHFSQLCVLGPDTRIPLSVNYDRTTLGSDRLAAVVGAWALSPEQEILVLDAGTAITYERVSASGVYLGGNISPGLYVRLKAMHSYTCRLPQIDTIDMGGGLGTNTTSAMARGAVLGIVYEIEGYVRELKQQYPDAQVYMTGGDADSITALLSCDVTVIPDLVLLGLNLILEYNKGC